MKKQNKLLPSNEVISAEAKKYLQKLVNKPTPYEEFRIVVAFEYAAKWVRDEMGKLDKETQTPPPMRGSIN